jgi:PAS domain-containing protein
MMAPDVQGDWTDRRAAETDAGLRTALFDATEELAEIGSWEWFFATSELLWSDNLYRIYGVSPGEIKPTPEFVIAGTHPDDRERVARQVYETIESGEIRTLEYRWVRQDGQSVICGRPSRSPRSVPAAHTAPSVAFRT